MLRDRIYDLLKLKNATVKDLALHLGTSEASLYRWFREDSMELKYLRGIAEYFNKDVVYFFTSSNGSEGDAFNVKTVSKVNKESESFPGLKDKYIAVLEENSRLQREIIELKEKLAQYSMQLEQRSMPKQTG